MTENNAKPEDGKKYRVIDKRPSYDDVAPAAADAPPQAQEPPAEPAPAPPQDEPEEQQRSVQFEDLVALILNILRDQAVISLGMHFTAGPATRPNLDEARNAADLYREFANQYNDIIQSFIPDEYKQEPPPPSDLLSSLAMGINLVQSQALIQMGLIADPTTGLVVKDLPQAKKSIDLLAVLLDKFKPHLPEHAVKNVENAITDLRLNFVNQSKMP
jgi:hypothetical protein